MAATVTPTRQPWIQMELEVQLRNRLEQAIPTADSCAGRHHCHEPAGLLRRISAIQQPEADA